MVEQKELDSIITLPPNKRYEYTIKRICDFESLWVIGDTEGLKVYEDDSKTTVFPIWPFKEFAQLCCTGEFRSSLPEEIKLDEFLENYIPHFKKEGYKLSILPLPSDKGSLVSIETFESDLQNELDKY